MPRNCNHVYSTCTTCAGRVQWPADQLVVIAHRFTNFRKIRDNREAIWDAGQSNRDCPRDSRMFSMGPMHASSNDMTKSNVIVAKGISL